jgi:Tol biopolymer transport system component
MDHLANASVSPDGSLVAFDRLDPERQTTDIWVVGTNGELPRQIRASLPPDQMGHSMGVRGYVHPVWCSNGQRLFYFRHDDKDRAIESCDLSGANVTTIFSSKDVGFNFCWAPDGRVLFPMPVDGRELWEIKVDPVSGQPLGQARRITQLSGFSTVGAQSFSITADAKQLVMLKMNLQGDVYVAEAEAGGKSMKALRRLTQDETDDAVWDWTADSQAVLFVSYRNGNGDILKQDISQTEAETIVATLDDDWHPNLSPDGTFILYLVSEKRGALATRLMRVPVAGGASELVLRGEKIKNFSCARQANLCVLVEGEVKGKQTLTTFDPLKGRGEQLPMSDYPDFGRGILSPQGRLIEKMKSGPDGLHIRIRSLTGGPIEEITFKNLTGEYKFSGWSVDGKGIYIWEVTLSDFTSFYVGLDGHSQVLWKRRSNPGYWIDYPVPSPDGRYLACTIVTAESNAWMLENF